MYHLFLDESGEFGSAQGSSAFMVIAVLSTTDSKRLKNRIRKQKKALYDAGWPRSAEIKGTALWNSHRNEQIPQAIVDNKERWLERFVTAALPDGVRAHYSVVRKERVTPNLLNAPYGIAYNYYAGMLLIRAYKDHFAGPITLIADQRNKETHKKLQFDSYIITRLITDCDHAHPLTIKHMESHDVLGLQAVDFISWALFRHYEHKDGRFRALIQPSLGYRDSWYA